MSALAKFPIFVATILTISLGTILASPIVLNDQQLGSEVEFEGGLGEYVDAEPEQDLWIPSVVKSGGFWAPHPSDFTPMRRLESRTRNINWSSKRVKPYHPIARQNPLNSQDENVFEIPMPPEKRQSPGSYLLMKLGRTTGSRNGGGQTGRGTNGRK